MHTIAMDRLIVIKMAAKEVNKQVRLIVNLQLSSNRAVKNCKYFVLYSNTGIERLGKIAIGYRVNASAHCKNNLRAITRNSPSTSFDFILLITSKAEGLLMIECSHRRLWVYKHIA